MQKSGKGLRQHICLHLLATAGGRVPVRGRKANAGPFPPCCWGDCHGHQPVRAGTSGEGSGLLPRPCWVGHETRRARSQRDAQRSRECGQDLRAGNWRSRVQRGSERAGERERESKRARERERAGLRQQRFREQQRCAGHLCGTMTQRQVKWHMLALTVPSCCCEI